MGAWKELYAASSARRVMKYVGFGLAAGVAALVGQRRWDEHVATQRFNRSVSHAEGQGFLDDVFHDDEVLHSPNAVPEKQYDITELHYVDPRMRELLSGRDIPDYAGHFGP